MRKFDVIVYGSYGYTGTLIVEECKKTGLRVLLSGRHTEALKTQSHSTGFPYEPADINDSAALEKVLAQGNLVIHCAGPFQYTARQAVLACLRTGTHYLDISGEFQVFEALQRLDAEAKERGIVIMPGTGFDVVPTDCLAVHLKHKLPTATHLELGFAMSKGGLSRGTAKTMVEGMGDGSMVREHGKLTKIDLGSRSKIIDFGTFKAHTICIPWGDISTAYRSTGIPNIEVYSAVPKKMIRIARASRWLGWLLRRRWFKNLLLARIDRKPPGPSKEKLETGRCYVWGCARDANGNSVEARLETPSGYKLTGQMTVTIASRILNGERRAGYFTPAEYFGPELMVPR